MSDLTFVVRRQSDDKGWIIRSQSVLGESPVGPRLAKGSDYPEFGQVFKTKEEAEKVAVNWNDWYYGQPYLKKKRKSKYLA
jgi:hypothetical protein